ncbi:uncharacterized protein LOC144523031 [Sander vitreus]
MMKLILSLTLIWALCSIAGALRCQTCADQECSTTITQTCSSETFCLTASIQAISSGTPTRQIFKACASSSVCPATGSQTFSVNLGASLLLRQITAYCASLVTLSTLLNALLHYNVKEWRTPALKRV